MENIDKSDNSDPLSLTDSNISICADGSSTSALTDSSDSSSLVDNIDEKVPIDNSYASAHVEVETYMHTESLVGLPADILVDGETVKFGPYIPARRAAIAYCLSVGISPNSLPRTYARVDKDKARSIALLYDKMESTPHNAVTQASYRALADETLA
ncbi:hypothetical protein PISL3812_00007 [Talaromyces islandicus]|uniref:Uncharacterized protein n=1 Tax=Talaromyces islandicus TaxID=28573 RepID=A0A0U1LI20_TALIS|nr:hypothetical protein PISL3812_00007 [Talaromyces islandicus]